jgi:hypothetical protein
VRLGRAASPIGRREPGDVHAPPCRLHGRMSTPQRAGWRVSTRSGRGEICCRAQPNGHETPVRINWLKGSAGSHRPPGQAPEARGRARRPLSANPALARCCGVSNRVPGDLRQGLVRRSLRYPCLGSHRIVGRANPAQAFGRGRQAGFQGAASAEHPHLSVRPGRPRTLASRAPSTRRRGSLGRGLLVTRRRTASTRG